MAVINAFQAIKGGEFGEVLGAEAVEDLFGRVPQAAAGFGEAKREQAFGLLD